MTGPVWAGYSQSMVVAVEERAVAGAGRVLERDLAVAVELAREAGRVALGFYGNVERLTKTHATTTGEAVTLADRAAQRKIVAGLREHYPHDGIIGEESDTGQGITADNLKPDGRNWVIDPIDGTNNFIAELGNWCICIGLLDAGHPVLGVVYDVTRDAMYAGADRLGATKNGQPCHVKPGPMNAASLVMMTSNLLDEKGTAPPWALRWLNQSEWKLRMLGSAALEATMVGAGIAQAAVTINGKLWDAVAPAAFTLAAGGVVVHPSGAPLFPFNVTGYHGRKVPFLATTPDARDQVLSELAKGYTARAT